MSKHPPAAGGIICGLCLLIVCATGCTRLAPVRVTVAPAPPPRTALAADTDLQRYVADTVAQARQHLQADTVLATLRRHRRWVDAAKWGTVGLSAATTALGTYGGTQDPEKKWVTYTTLGIGVVATVATAITSDADTAKRIAACEQVAKDGNVAIDTYNATWSVRVLTAPPQSDAPAFKKFVDDLIAASTAMVTAVNGMMVSCY